jgi:hypothetical protein
MPWMPLTNSTPKGRPRSIKSPGTDLVKSAQSARIESRPSVGLGTDLCLESSRLTGFVLALEGQVLHLVVFVRPSNGKKANHPSSMARVSNRTGNHQ